MNLDIIDIDKFDPEWNLALETQLIDLVETNTLLIRFWRNDKSVILGRFQDPSFEIDQDYCNKNDIPFFKRKSGGGTVFHDLGNLNVSFVINKNSLKRLTDHKGALFFSKCMLEVLRMKIPELCHDEKRNAFYYNKKKVMGSAAMVAKDCLLFHCSLLFSTDLQHLQNVILSQVDYGQAKKTIVASHRDKVINLSQINSDCQVDFFKKNLVKYLINRFKLSLNREIVTFQNLDKIRG